MEVFEAGLTAADLDAFREELEAAHPGIAFSTDYRDADVAVLFLDPSTGDYFHATGLLDLQIHKDTNVRMAKVQKIREAVGTLVVSVDHKLAWIPENVEPLADVLLAGFDTRKDVVFEAVTGKFRPTGVLPLTLPADDAAVAVDTEGRCASPNDVPGYAKEQHMGGRKYAYTDAVGNRYVSGFGLGG